MQALNNKSASLLPLLHCRDCGNALGYGGGRISDLWVQENILFAFPLRALMHMT